MCYEVLSSRHDVHRTHEMAAVMVAGTRSAQDSANKSSQEPSRKPELGSSVSGFKKWGGSMKGEGCWAVSAGVGRS